MVIDPKTSALYRRVFGTPEGKNVLADILNMTGHWTGETENPIGKMILMKIGVFDPVHADRLMDAYLDMPPIAIEEGKEKA